MKQNEFNLVRQDLWGAAQSISDMISRPEILDPDYTKPNFESAYELFRTEFQDRDRYVDWNKAAWYVAPTNEVNSNTYP